MPTKKNRTTVTDNRAITVEIDGAKHKLTLAEAQQLHDALGSLVGIRRPTTYPHPYYTSPWTLNCNANDNVIALNTTANLDEEGGTAAVVAS